MSARGRRDVPLTQPSLSDMDTQPVAGPQPYDSTRPGVDQPRDQVRELRVRLWFGPHLLHDYRAGAEAAERYAEAIGKRFAGLRVTLDSAVTADLSPLPCEQLWTLTP